MKLGKLKIGAGAVIDKEVVLGYISGRTAAKNTLFIGNNARIRTGTIIYAGTTMGDNLETGHNVIIREENKVGNNVIIWSNSVIDYGCVVGNNVLIHNLVYIAQYTVIEDGVFLAPGAMIANDKYPIEKTNLKGPTIKNGAIVGINSTIMPGIVIGKNAVIGGGSVVTGNVPDNAVVCGNPARFMCNKDEIYSRER